ncbi:MAG: CDP-alcohol phosphatidyltransferase family protein [Desulfurococcales archaeon]|nr:CDP-alcohol phosphatidyltransferase family protein [Desulfurococcales archaeon]
MRPADAATLAGGALAGASMPLAVAGHYSIAVRLLMLAYLCDVLDGWLARRYGGSTSEGLMLDRALDRVSQVLAPLTLYTAWVSARLTPLESVLLALYAGGIVAVAFWRLVHRIVWRLTHFAGLPLFVHAGVMLSSYIADSPVNPLILLALLAASAAPIPYVRRLSKSSSTPSPGVAPRAAAVLVLALLPYRNPVVILLGKLVLISLLLYAAVGALPPLLGVTPGPRSGESGRSTSHQLG